LKINFIYFIVILSWALGASELKVLTYNIHALVPIIAGDDPHNRVPEIFLKSRGNDIIFFQENWIYADQYIAGFLPDHQVIKSKSSKFIWPLNNGSGLTLAISDSIRVLEINDISYKSCSGWLSKDNDCLATKGFQHARVEINGAVVDLYNTHLDAGGSDSDMQSRIEQFRELERYIAQESDGFPVILAGDLNVDSDSDEFSVVSSFCSALNLEIAEWESIKKDFLFGKLDYILYRGTANKAIKLSSCAVDTKINGLSDHPPIRAIFN